MGDVFRSRLFSTRIKLKLFLIENYEIPRVKKFTWMNGFLPSREGYNPQPPPASYAYTYEPYAADLKDIAKIHSSNMHSIAAKCLKSLIRSIFSQPN